MHRTIAHDLGKTLWALPDPNTLVIQHTQDVDWLTIMDGVIARSHTVEVSTPMTGAPIHWGLIGNPAKAVMRPGAERGKRQALPPSEWKAWAQRKLGEAINPHSIDATAMPTAHGTKPGMRTTHKRVLFTGTGSVANRDRLAALQHNGVGPGKAYGCGLLIIQETA